jgi:hypothetical protein
MTEAENIQRLRASVLAESSVTDLLMMILDRQDTIIERQSDTDMKLDGHMKREDASIEMWLQSLPKRPDGHADIDGHRDYHQEIIEEARARKTMWRELRSELVKKGAWGIVIVLSALVMYWWDREVKK